MGEAPDAPYYVSSCRGHFHVTQSEEYLIIDHQYRWDTAEECQEVCDRLNADWRYLRRVKATEIEECDE